MSIHPMQNKTKSKYLISAVTALTMLTSVIPVAPGQADAVSQPDTLASANARMDANLSSLQQQAGSISQQSAEVAGQVADLQNQYNTLVPKLDQKQVLLKQAIHDAYVTGEPGTLEVLASNSTFSGVLGQQNYREQIGAKTKKAAEELSETKQQVSQKLNDAKEKQEGLGALQASLQDKIVTAESQAAAKQALAEATQGKEEEYQKMVAAAAVETAAAAINTPASAAPSPSTRPGVVSPPPSAPPANSGGGSVRSGGNNPYPYGQCTWYVYNQTGRGQNGNAGSWQPTSSNPAVGKIMIWRSGEMGASGAGHVGVVTGVSGNMVTVREMNWNGGPGVVSTHTQPSTGKFY